MLYREEDVCPCKGCTDRYVGCHPECGRHQEWKTKHEEARENHYSNKKKALQLYNYNIETKIKAKLKKK